MTPETVSSTRRGRSRRCAHPPLSFRVTAASGRDAGAKRRRRRRAHSALILAANARTLRQPTGPIAAGGRGPSRGVRTARWTATARDTRPVSSGDPRARHASARDGRGQTGDVTRPRSARAPCSWRGLRRGNEATNARVRQRPADDSLVALRDAADDGTAPARPVGRRDGEPAGMPSECGNMSYVAANPGATRSSPAWHSRVCGRTPRGAASGRASGRRVAGCRSRTGPASDRLRSGGAGSVLGERFLHGGPGAFRTTDGGRTFEPLGDIDHLDGLSVDLSDPKRRTARRAARARRPVPLDRWGRDVEQHRAEPSARDRVRIRSRSCSTPRSIWWARGRGVRLLASSAPRTAERPGSGSRPAACRPSPRRQRRVHLLAAPGGGGLSRSTDGGVTWTAVRTAGVLASYNIVELADGRLRIGSARRTWSCRQIRARTLAGARSAAPARTVRTVWRSPRRATRSSCGSGIAATVVPPARCSASTSRPTG